LTSNATGVAPAKSTATSTAHAAQPTTQESFFKTVSKRLQLLESNSTLSLKYIEEQSKILREAFSKVEKRQLGKTTLFLENLNSTVLAELRRFGLQYDQMWQSTVIELENQREESHREIAAVSARLNVLAEELVFQRRMSIVQSVLLLLCLGLVILSRSLTSGIIDVPMIQNFMTKSRSISEGTSEDDPNSQHVDPSRAAKSWPHMSHSRHRSERSDESVISRGRDDSPPTPFSAYSGQEEDTSIYMRVDSTENPNRNIEGALESKPTKGGLQQNLFGWQEGDLVPQEAYRPSTSRLPPPLGYGPQEIANLSNTGVEPSASAQKNLKDSYNGQFSRHDTPHEYSPEPSNMSNYHQQKTVPLTSSRLPSPPPERQKPEFSIARKPLPALPDEAN